MSKPLSILLKPFDVPITRYFPRSIFLHLCHWDRADSKAELGKHAGAIADYDRAIALKPDTPEVYYNRGHSKAELGNHADAIDDYDRAIALKPKYSGGAFLPGHQQC